MQANWIGRSEGAEVEFALCDEAGEPTEERITVFTTRPDTLFGCTLLPAGAGASRWSSAWWPVSRCGGRARGGRTGVARETAVERQLGERDKHGAFTGRYVENPVNGERIPIWVADYVLMDYGTGAVMAVPSGDQRDFEFARQYVTADRSGRGCRRGRRARQLAGVLERGAAGGRLGGGVRRPGRDGATPASSPAWPAARRARACRRSPRGSPSAARAGSRSTSACATGSSAASGTGVTRFPAVHCPSCGLVPVPIEQLPVVLPMDIDITQGRDARRSPRVLRDHVPGVRRPCQARDRHDGHVHVLVAGTTCATATRATTNAVLGRTRRTTGCRSTSTSAVSSTRSCTCCTRASSPRFYRDMGLLGCRRAVHEPAHAGHGQARRRDDEQVARATWSRPRT